jgi:two-component system NtrC family sensor kinase
VDVGVHSEDEIGELARSFERMAGELRRAQEENLEWAQSLETKVREKTRELERAQAHLIHVEKMASLGKLSAVIAHEINNPLASVMTYARLVSRRLGKETPLDPEARQRLQEHLSMIESETRRCGDIVKNMLIFAKKTPMGLREVDLREVIDRASRLVQHGLEIQQVEFRRELPEIDYRVVCSADQIQQMLVALMVNATEAMETDGGVLTLSVRTRDPYLVEIAVSDTGTGIPEEIRGQIFEPFFTTKDGTRGVGLGLAVVHGIVESHGGTIDVDSVPGRGTTFRVTLPRRPPRQKDRGGE